jgi:hypothetical protein
MTKKFRLVLLLPLLLASGCVTDATFTNLTPSQRTRNADNLYPVEVALTSRQQSLRWDSIQPQIVVGTEYYKMHQTPLMKNRWEGVIPVPPGTNLVYYHYKFGFQYNAFGSPKSDSTSSREYSLRIME